MNGPPPLRPDETHDPALASWVESANRPGADFPIQNLPLGVFRPSESEGSRIGVAIGEMILDLAGCAELGLLDEMPDVARACTAPALNALMALPAPARRGLRRTLSELLRVGSAAAADRRLRERALVPRDQVALLLPAAIGDYTDFYASVFHAANVGSMLRPDQPLLPNYKWVPIGYHGRASSVVVSGTPVRLPEGQLKAPDTPGPGFGPTRQLDYELELAAWVAGENPLGTPVPIAEAETRIFGVSILNDWSARDIQAWEYQPLGPFLAKNFATTVSPWVVTWEALAPFRVPAFARPDGDPPPLPYLDTELNRSHGGVAITLEVRIASARMRELGLPAFRLSRADFSQMYWTLAQLVTHHTSNGCNLRPGDLLASGTISGPEPGQRGCLLELAWRGKHPIRLPTGEERRFLEDGDEVIMTAWCERAGARRIGLGECRGVVTEDRERQTVSGDGTGHGKRSTVNDAR